MGYGINGTSVEDIVLKTINGGTLWTQETTETWAPLFRISFPSINNAIAVGYGGIIIRSTNGGVNWTQQESETIFDLTGLSFTDTNNGTAVGMVGRIRRTTNGGETWTTQFSGTLNNFLGVSLSDSLNGTAIGADGVIFRTTNGGVTFIEGEQNKNIEPTIFMLSQNYPNPFNPSTTISYQLPVTGLVTLKVYDLLGREVAELVNEEKSVGNYEVEFNASHLASGIYFYSLSAGDFHQTKKLILMK